MRSVLYIAALVIVMLPNSLLAQNTPAYPWEGEVTGTNVFVRSGAGNNWYPTTKLNQGDRVLVLGEKFGWYQISPPADSFSYVDASSVDRKAGSKTATIKQDKTYIRAGSHLEDRKGSTQVVLNHGDTVEIIGEADGFFRIKPPPGAALYISRQYIRSVAGGQGTGMVERHVADNPQAAPKDQSSLTANASGTPPIDVSAVKIPTSFPSTPGESPALAADVSSKTAADESLAPSSQPAMRKDSTSLASRPPVKKRKDVPAATPTPPAEGRYKTTLAVLETELGAMMRKPMDQQDFTDLRKRYEEIVAQTDEYVPAQIAKIRLRQINDRSRLQLARVDLRKSHQELTAYRAGMDEERIKIMNRRIEVAKEKYDLEGELRESAAFAPELHRYRLIDPNSKATIAYVDIPPSADPDARFLIGRLVGIRTSGQQFSTAARVPIAVAARVVDLSPRAMSEPEVSPADRHTGEKIVPANTKTEPEKKPDAGKPDSEPPSSDEKPPEDSDSVGTP